MGDSPITTDGGLDALPDTMVNDGGGGTDADAAPSKCVFPEGGAPGTLDQSFATQIFQDIGNPLGATIDPAGNLYVAGFENNNFKPVCFGTSLTAASIVKITPQGVEDSTFGTTSQHLCIGPSGTITVIYALAYDRSDGTIVGAGYQTSSSATSTGRLLVVRFDTAGHLVSSFGASGQKIIDAVSGKASTAFGLALDTSANPAKIVVVGTDGWFFGPTADTAFVARLNHDGSPDLGFNGGVPLLDTTAYQFTSVLVDSTGAIFAAGATGSAAAYTPVLRKATAAGAWDPAFNGGSPVSIPLTSSGLGEAWGLANMGQQVAVAVAEGSESASSLPVGLAGYQLNGSAGLAPGPVAINSAPLQVNMGYFSGVLANDCEGRVLVSGYLDQGDAGYHSIIGRYQTGGALDTTFGTGGFGTVVNINAAPGTPVIEDPNTGRLLVLMRTIDPQNAPRLALGRLYR